MTRAVIKHEGNFVLSVPMLGAQPYLGRNLHKFVYSERNMNSVFKSAEPFRVDFINEKYAEQARKLEEKFKEEAKQVEERAKEIKIKEAQEELIERSKTLKRFRIIGANTKIIKDSEKINEEIFFEYDIRRNFGLIYFLSIPQTGKNKPVNLEKALAELNKMEFYINI